MIKGNIVIVHTLGKYAVDDKAMLAGAGGIIVVNHSRRPFPSFMYPIPAIVVSQDSGKTLYKYMSQCGDLAIVEIKQTEVAINEAYKAAVSASSSKGSNPWSPYILKPDVVAKGEKMACAVRQDEEKPNKQKYTISEGTSVSTPVVAVGVNDVRSQRPNWSASAAKSAVMTTATRITDDKNRTVRGSGCGEINPSLALNPGLVYEIPLGDYCKYIKKSENCGPEVQEMMRSYVGTTKFGQFDCWNLNYPSFRAPIPDDDHKEWTFQRVVTYVGKELEETFTCHCRSDEGLELFINPLTMTFDGPSKSLHAKVKAWNEKED